MMFPSFGCNTVYTFRTLKPLERVFRQNPVEGGRPTWPNDRHKNFLFVAGNCWNYELWCFKKRKYHVLKLCQTRFCIFYIFFDKNWENWFRGIEFLKRDFRRRPAVGRPPCFVKNEMRRPADSRPTSKIPSKIFFDKKIIFAKKIAKIMIFMHPKCVFSIFQIISEVGTTYLMLKSMFSKFSSAVFGWVPLF